MFCQSRIHGSSIVEKSGIQKPGSRIFSGKFMTFFLKNGTLARKKESAILPKVAQLKIWKILVNTQKEKVLTYFSPQKEIYWKIQKNMGGNQKKIIAHFRQENLESDY